MWTERRKGVDDNPGGKTSQYRPELDVRLDGRGSGHGDFLCGRSLVPGRPCNSGKRMVLDEADSYKKLEKRPADAGLFIVFEADEQDDYFDPRGILHREGAGRSWAMNNTSNTSGVE